MARPSRSVALAVGLGLVLTACSETQPAALDDPPQLSSVASTSSPTGTSASPSSTSPRTASSTTAAPTPARSAVAVYWLGAAAAPRGPRLYREWLSLAVTDDPVRTAVEAMLSREPSDPDYTSLWADGTTVRATRREGTTAIVDLSAQAQTNGGGSGFEAFTVQQLVHTVTAADPSIEQVRVLVEGKPVETLWGATGLSSPVRRAPAAETLAPVWLDVGEGATVNATFGGTATVFEATVSWSVRSGEKVVLKGFSTAEAGAPGRGAWSAELDVAPGDYELRAWESSARDGSVTWLDTKRVRVS